MSDLSDMRGCETSGQSGKGMRRYREAVIKGFLLE